MPQAHTLEHTRTSKWRSTAPRSSETTMPKSATVRAVAAATSGAEYRSGGVPERKEFHWMGAEKADQSPSLGW